MKRGSVWNKWDLHLHSPRTYLNNNYQDCSIDEFVKKVVDSGVKAVGLTNYFKFHVDDLTTIKQALNNQGIIVFPNLEFRTQPQNKENDEMHIHVIFSDTIPTNKIDGFLSRLKTVDDKYCKDLSERDIQTSTIAFDTLRTKLDEDKDLRHFEDYLIIACPRGDGNFRPQSSDDGRGNNLAILIDKKTDILFGNSGDTEFYLDTTRYEGAEPKPVLYCSDAHSLAQIGNGLTWIKADLTFEGLKQILWEPRNRVRIQERDPNEEKSSRIVIERLIYKNPNGSNQEVLLNKDLNSIIGVRGSGKSTLLKNVALAVDPHQFDIKEKIDRLYQLDSFKVVWGDGQEGSGTDESPKSIFFIPQNYLSLLAYDEAGKSEARDKFLTDLLKKNIKFSNALKTYSDFVSNNRVKVEGLIEDLVKANQQLIESSKLLRKQGSRKEIEDEIKKKSEDINKYKGSGSNTLSEKEVVDYTDAKSVVSEASKKISVLNQDKLILASIIKTGADVYIANQEIARLSNERQLLLRSELLKKSRENLDLLLKSEVAKVESEITSMSKLITTKQGLIESLEQKIKANKTLEILTKELGVLQQTLRTITELEITIKQTTEAKENDITSLVDAYLAYDTQQETIFQTIKFDENFTFLQIDIVTYYNTDDLKRFVERNINTVSSSPLINGDQDLKKLFSDNPEKPSAELIRKCINKFINGEIRLKVEAGDVGDVISQLIKDRFEIDYLNSVKTKDSQILFKNMTGGQKAIAMLELIFRFDDERYPILIDQPEDDLDVSGVATDLVNFIKSEKDKRQIIIVSHNGSLVVCADSEEVIACESEKLAGNKYNFIYDSGAIETPSIREKIIKVLEGGKDALKQRARKLNFKHEI